MLPMSMSDDEKPEQIAMFPMYSFVGTDWSFVTYNEVFGIFTNRATLVGPHNSWIEESKTDAPRLLDVKAQMLLTAKVTPQPTERTLFTIRTRRPDELKGWKRPSVSTALQQMHLDDYWKAKSPFHTIILKQIRDACCGDRACYVSLVGLRRTIEIAKPDDTKVIDPPIAIEICDEESEALVHHLGLVTEERNHKLLETDLGIQLPSGSRMIDESAKNLCWQAGSKVWHEGI
jgi:hypothetical protein